MISYQQAVDNPRKVYFLGFFIDFNIVILLCYVRKLTQFLKDIYHVFFVETVYSTAFQRESFDLKTIAPIEKGGI